MPSTTATGRRTTAKQEVHHEGAEEQQPRQGTAGLQMHTMHARCPSSISLRATCPPTRGPSPRGTRTPRNAGVVVAAGRCDQAEAGPGVDDHARGG